MARSVKHRLFLRDAKRGEVHRNVTRVPGIGKTIGGRLTRDGISTSMKLYTRYLRNKKGFRRFIEKYGGNVRHQEEAYRAMKEWKP